MRSFVLGIAAWCAAVGPAPGVELKELIASNAMPGWEEKAEAESPLTTSTWEIKDGILHCLGRKGGGWWGSKKDYTDVIVDFEFKLPPAGNSGVYLRVPRKGHPTYDGMEIQILDDFDPLYTEQMKIVPGQHCGAIYKIAPPEKEVLKRAGEWNHMHIEAVADHVTVTLNDQTIVDADGQSYPEILKRSKSGPIGFQNHSSELWFRNIRFADLAADRAERARWFRDAKFGMFIHWGVYSVQGQGEWVMQRARIKAADYEKLPPQFDASAYDPKAWAALAKRAGCKYVVITSKHHDGFDMFDSKVSPYTVVQKTAYAKDPLKPLADAVRGEGLRFGFYHSILDWHHPDYAPVPDWDAQARAGHKPEFDKYLEYLQTQVRELCTNYGPLACIWWDGGWEHNNPADKRKFAAINHMIRELQPQILINNRTNLPEDFDTPEQYIPPTGLTNDDGTPKLWENCITLTTGHGSFQPTAWWGYDKSETEFKTPDYCIRMLVDVVSKGGNLLLNVGPDSHGRIGPHETQALEAMGKWLAVNGESIYGTTASPFKYLPFYGRATVKGGTLYVHVFAWPSDNKLTLPGLRNEIRSARLVASSRTLDAQRNRDGVVIALAASAPDPVDSVVALQLDGVPVVDPVTVTPGADGSVELPAFTAQLHGQLGQQIRLEPVGGTSPPELVCIANWTKATDYATWQFELQSPGKYAVQLQYAAGSDGKFELSDGQSRLSSGVPPTRPDEIAKTHLGELDLPAGRSTLQLKPVTIPAGKGLMRLISLKLAPAEKK